LDHPEQGDRQDWIEAALDTYEGRLLRYATRLTGDAVAARDVVQEVFGRLCCEDPAELNGRLAPWLFAVTRNLGLDLRRKEKRMIAAEVGILASRETAEGCPAQTAEAKQESRRMLELLATLPANQQEVVRLKFQEGLRYREIADVTGLTVGNVGFLLHTALKTLRGQMGEG